MDVWISLFLDGEVLIHLYLLHNAVVKIFKGD